MQQFQTNRQLCFLILCLRKTLFSLLGSFRRSFLPFPKEVMCRHHCHFINIFRNAINYLKKTKFPKTSRYFFYYKITVSTILFHNFFVEKSLLSSSLFNLRFYTHFHWQFFSSFKYLEHLYIICIFLTWHLINDLMGT